MPVYLRFIALNRCKITRFPAIISSDKTGLRPLRILHFSSFFHWYLLWLFFRCSKTAAEEYLMGGSDPFLLQDFSLSQVCSWWNPLVNQYMVYATYILVVCRYADGCYWLSLKELTSSACFAAVTSGSFNSMIHAINPLRGSSTVAAYVIKMDSGHVGVFWWNSGIIHFRACHVY